VTAGSSTKGPAFASLDNDGTGVGIGVGETAGPIKSESDRLREVEDVRHVSAAIEATRFGRRSDKDDGCDNSQGFYH